MLDAKHGAVVALPVGSKSTTKIDIASRVHSNRKPLESANSVDEAPTGLYSAHAPLLIEVKEPQQGTTTTKRTTVKWIDPDLVGPDHVSPPHAEDLYGTQPAPVYAVGANGIYFVPSVPDGNLVDFSPVNYDCSHFPCQLQNTVTSSDTSLLGHATIDEY